MLSKKALKRKARSFIALFIVFSIVLMPISVIAQDVGADAGGTDAGAGDAGGSDFDSGGFDAGDDFGSSDFDTGDFDTGDFDAGDLGSGDFDFDDVGAGDFAVTDYSVSDTPSFDALESDGSSAGDALDETTTTDAPEATETAVDPGANDVDAGEVGMAEGEGAEEAPAGGNSYVVSGTPNGIVGSGLPTEFSITFTEVGLQSIGSVEIKADLNKLSLVGDKTSVVIDAPNPADWFVHLYDVINSVIEIRAVAAGGATGHYIQNGDSLSVKFTATPKESFEFETRASTSRHGSNNDRFTTSPNNPNADPTQGAVNGGIIPITVSDTIQGAISAPAIVDGDTIYVHPKTYNEALNINKSLTLIGSGPSDAPTSIITSTAARVIQLTAKDKNFAFQNLIIEGNGSNLGIHAGSAIDINSLSLQDVIVRNCKVGVYMSENYSSGAFQPATINSLLFDNVTLNNNSHIGAYIGKAVLSGLVTDSTITNNGFTDADSSGWQKVGLQFVDFHGGVPPRVQVLNSNFSNNGAGASSIERTGLSFYTATAIKAAEDLLTVSGCTFTNHPLYAVRIRNGHNVGNTATINGTFSNNYLDIWFNNVNGTTNSTTLVRNTVAGIRTVGAGPTFDYNTIQAAINAANAGETVDVAAGIYNENLIVSKSLILKGATAGISKFGYIVPTSYAYNAFMESIIRPTTAGHVIEITAPEVTIDGFIIAHENQSTSGNRDLITLSNQNIDYTNVQIINNVIGPNQNTSEPAANKGRMGISVQGPSASKVVITIKNNLIHDANGDGVGILLLGPSVPEGNEGPAGAGATVAGTGNGWTGKYSGSVIEGNEITGNHRAGIELAGGCDGGADPSDYLKIINNTISNHGLDASDDPNNLKYGHGIVIIRTGGTRTHIEGRSASNVLISNNIIENNEKSGIYVGPKSRNLLIKENIISNNGNSGSPFLLWDGIRIDLEEKYYPDSLQVLDFIEGISINNNAITNNGDYGVQVIGGVPTKGPIDATNNWWGDASGPEHATNPSGTGDKVSDNVLFDSWLEKDPFAPDPEPDPAPGDFGGTFFNFDFAAPLLATAGVPALVITEGTGITASFLTQGTAADLAAAKNAYQTALQALNANRANMTPAQIAVAELDLLVAQAAILALEVALGTANADLAAAVAAYNAAVAALAQQGGLLNAAQQAAVADVLAAVAAALTARGAAL